MTDVTPQPFPDVRAALAEGKRPEPWLADDVRAEIDRIRRGGRKLAAKEPREDVAEVSDVDAGGVPCRIYRPDGGSDATIVHVHGGGFVFNDVDVHDAPCRRLANRSGMTVVSVDYRRPPEHPFPAAVEDLDAVVDWLGDADLPGPRLGHGDSAGANLILVAALRNPGAFAGLGLIYPFLAPRGGYPSYELGAEAGFTPAEAAWYWEQYAPPGTDLDDPDLAPLNSDRLGTLPPTMVVTAEFDPLRDEGEELARRAVEAGADVVGFRMLGQIHGFWRHPRVYSAAEPLTAQVAAFLRSRL